MLLSTHWASSALGSPRSWPSHLINHRPVSCLVNHQSSLLRAVHPALGDASLPGRCAPHCANCACRDPVQAALAPGSPPRPGRFLTEPLLLPGQEAALLFGSASTLLRPCCCPPVLGSHDQPRHPACAREAASGCSGAWGGLGQPGPVALVGEDERRGTWQVAAISLQPRPS